MNNISSLGIVGHHIDTAELRDDALAVRKLHRYQPAQTDLANQPGVLCVGDAAVLTREVEISPRFDRVELR